MAIEGGPGSTGVETPAAGPEQEEVWRVPDPDVPVVVHGSWLARRTKRVIDAFVGSALLVGAAPVMAAVAGLVAATSPGPVLFRQLRVSEGGELFECIKFRTMVDGAADALPDLLALDEDLALEFSEGHKLRDDPRTTPVGKVLRVWSLDELPQLLNVVRGDMSLIGPRPVVPLELIEHYGSRGAQLMTVPPGLSGAWQVAGRNDLSYAERVEIDIEYTTNWSLIGDLKLFLRTIAILARPKSNGSS